MAFKDIRKSRKWLSPQEIRIIVVFLVILSALLALNVHLSQTVPGGEWLYLRWNGLRSYFGMQADSFVGVKGSRLMRGRTPDGEVVIFQERPAIYGGAIARRVQQIVYGRDAFPNEYRYILSDPFPIALLYSPLTVISNFPIVRAVWMLFAEAALLLSVLFSYRLSEWEPPLVLNILLIAFGLFSFFSLNALLTASPAIFLNLIYLGILLALRSFSDELAGALLFLAAYQWEVGGLFFLVILIYVFANRRWGVLAGFGMALVILAIISFLIDPSWGLPYFRAVLSNLIQGEGLNLGVILAEWFPQVPFPLGRVISIFIAIVVIIEALGAVNAPFRRLVWVVALALAAMPLAGLAIFPANYVILILPLVLVVSLIWERWKRRRYIVLPFILLVVFAAPFYLYYETVIIYAPFYTQLLAVLPPLAMVIALYWMRWWVVHTPRIWADQIGNRR